MDDLLFAEELTLEQALSLGDMELRMHDGSSRAHWMHLALASPVLRSALAQNGVVLQVEGSHRGWMELLRLLYHHLGMHATVELSLEAAYQVLPIAHTYDMRAVMRLCVQTVQQAGLAVRLPDGSKMVDQAHTCLLEWLALGDQCQLTDLVRTCLAQLERQGIVPAVRSALARRPLAQLVHGLRSENMGQLLRVMSDLPPAYKGCQVPDLSQAPNFHKEVTTTARRFFHPCMAGKQCLYLASQVNKVFGWDFEKGSEFELVLPTRPYVISAPNVCSGSSNQLLLSGNIDKTLRLWDLNNRQQLHTLNGHGTALIATCFCGPTNERAASGDMAGCIKLWDLASGRNCTPLPMNHQEDVSGLASSLYASLLLSSSSDKMLKLWDQRDGRCIRTLEGHTHWVTSISMDAAGRNAVSGSVDNTVRCWDLGSGRCRAILEGHEERVRSVAMDHHATCAVSGSWNTVCHWDLSNGVLLAVHKWPGDTSTYMCASFDLSRLALFSRPVEAPTAIGNIKVWCQ